MALTSARDVATILVQEYYGQGYAGPRKRCMFTLVKLLVHGHYLKRQMYGVVGNSQTTLELKLCSKKAREEKHVQGKPFRMRGLNSWR
eukprot:scaffold95387_cov30-Tisochrysis_lutea.AAC.1